MAREGISFYLDEDYLNRPENYTYVSKIKLYLQSKNNYNSYPYLS